MAVNRTWTDQSGDWNTASLWSGGTIPGATDTAIFNTTTAYTATVGTGTTESDTVANVTLADANAILEISLGSTLTATGTVSLQTGALALAGVLSTGTIVGSAGTGSITTDGGTLSHTSIAGTVDVGGYDSALDVIGGLNFQTVGGSATLVVAGEYNNLAFLDGQTLSHGEIQLAGYATTLQAAAVAPVTLASGFTLDVVSNAATLAGSFVNQGTIRLEAGAELSLGLGSFTNTGVIELEQDAELVVGSLTTAQLVALAGQVVNQGGDIEVTGTLNNTGATLNLATAPLAGALILSTATVLGGTIVAPPGANLEYGTLSGVTYLGTLDVAFDLTVVNGLHLAGASGSGPGAIALTADSSLAFLDSETLDNATVTASSYGNAISGPAAGTLTLGSGLIVQVGAGASVLFSAGSLVDHAAITVAAGGEVEFSFTGAQFTDTGSVNIAAGGIVAIDGTLTTAQLVADLAGITGAGTIELNGTVLNTGAVLDIPGAVLVTGNIVGGTVVNAGLLVAGSGAAFRGVTFQGPLNFGTADFTDVTITGGVTLETDAGAPGGAIDLGGYYDELILGDAETLAAGVLNVTGIEDSVVATTPTLTLGSGFSVNASGFDIISATTLVSAAAIAVTGELILATSTLLNTGTVTVASGATLALGYSQFDDATGLPLLVSGGGKVALASGATLDLGSAETTAQVQSLLGAGTGLSLGVYGTLTNTGASVTVGATGSLTDLVLDGDIIGGTIVNGGGSVTVLGGTLAGVTFDGALNTGSFGVIDVVGGLTLKSASGAAGGVVNVGNEETLDILDAETLNGAIVNLSGADDIDAASTLNLGSGLTLDVTGRAGLSAPTIVNAGKIVVAAGADLALQSAAIVNSGSIGVAAGGELDVGGGFGLLALTETGTIALAAGSTLRLNGTVTTAQVTTLLNTQPGVTLELDGTLINTASRLVTGSGPFTNVRLDGDVVGGTLVTSNDLTVLGGTLAGVTVQGALTLAAPNSAFEIVGGITLETAAGVVGGAVSVTASGVSLTIGDTETIDHATITILGSGDSISGQTLSFGPTLALDVFGSATVSATSIVNNGSLVAAGSLSALFLDTVSINNTGIISVGSGDVLGIGVDQYGNALTQALAFSVGGIPHTGGGISPFNLTLTSGATLEIGGIASTGQLANLIGTDTGVAIRAIGTLVNTGTTISSTPNGTLGNLFLDADVIGGTVANRGGSLVVGGGTFDNVTFAGPLNLGTSASLAIRDGLHLQAATGTAAGTITTAGVSNTLVFQDSETLANVIVNVATTSLSLIAETPILTLAASTTLNVGAAVAFNATTTVNVGKIIATGAASSVSFASANLINSGTITIGAGDTLALDTSSFAFGLGDKLALVNTGSIGIAAGGTLILGSTETTGQLLALLGSIAPTGVTVEILGTLINTGAALAIGSGALGNVILDADVIGGTIVNGGSLAVLGGTFDGVTFQGPLNLAHEGTALAIKDGLALQGLGGVTGGTLNVTGFDSQLDVLDATTLDTATITVAGTASLLIDSAVPTLTLGAGVTIDTGADVTLSASSAIISGASGTVTAGAEFGSSEIDYSADTIVNSGSVVVTAGAGLALDPSGPLTTNATLDVVNAGAFSLLPGANLTVGGAQTTAQLVSLVDGISQAGVTLTLDGTLANTGATLTLAPGVFGNVKLDDTIQGGTVVNAGATIGFGSVQLQTVTFVGPLVLASGSTYGGSDVGVTGGLTVLNTIGALPGAVTLPGRATLDFSGNQTFDNATVLITGANNVIDQGTLTLGRGVALSVNGKLLDDGGALTNNGVITVGSIGTSLVLFDQSVVNTGLITVGAGDLFGVSLAASSGVLLPFFNSGTVTLAAGATFQVGGVATDAQLALLLGSLSNPGVVVSLDGSLLNAGSVFTTTAGGLLNDVLLDASVFGGTIANGTGSLTVLGGLFDGVTYQGTLALAGTGLLEIESGITLENTAGTAPGALAVSGAFAGLDFIDSIETLSAASVSFSGSREELLFQTLTLAASLSLTVQSSVTLSGVNLTSNTNISEQTVSGTLEINAQTFTNNALISIGAGAVLDLESPTYLARPFAVGGAGSIAMASGSTLEIGGVATPGQLLSLIGSIVGTQTGVVVELDGEILNTGTTLAITPTGLLSNVILDADIIGGAVAAAGGSLTVIGGELNAVLFQGVLALAGTDDELIIQNGLSVVSAGGAAGTVELTGITDQLLLENTPTLDNVTIMASGTNDQIDQNGSILTLGTGFAADVTGYLFVAADTIVSQATIEVTTPDSVFSFAANTIVNTGTVFVGQTSMANAPAGSAAGVDTTVFGLAISLAVLQIGIDNDDPFGSYGPARTLLRALNYDDPNNVVFGTNSGLAIGSVVQTGQLAALFADFATQPGVVIFDGSIDNTGATFDITPTGTLSDVVLEANVSNGTIVDGGALSFALSTDLTGVTFVGALDVSANSNASVVLAQSTVISAGGGPGTIDINGTQDSVYIAGAAAPQTLTNLLVNLAVTAGATGDSLAVLGGTVTFGAGVTIDVGGTASISLFPGNGYNSPVGNVLVTNAGVINDSGALTIGAGDEPAAVFINTGLISAGAASGIGLSALGSFVNSGTISVSGAETFLVDSPSFSNSGTIALAGGATIDFALLPAAAGSIVMANGAETLRSDGLGLFTAGVTNFAVGDIIDLTAVAFAGATTSYANGVLDVFEASTLAAALTLPSFAYTSASFGLQADVTGGTEITINAGGTPAPCFLAGTRIRTTAGDVAVEDLAIGMSVVTQSGNTRPVVWIGQRRVDCRRHPRPELVQPIRVRAGAFAENMPVRDLRLSPDHSLFIDGVLIPVQHLLNGATIVREQVTAAHYFHVELSTHDVLYAEGLAAESYLDTGNRRAFANGETPAVLHPDFFPTGWENACAELCRSGPVVAATRARLLERARLAGYSPGQAAAPILLVGGRTILASAVTSDLYRFLLPANTHEVCIVSATGVPGGEDCRQLGVAVGGIVIHGRAVDLEDGSLVSGFYAVERRDGVRRRWTDGFAELDLPLRAGPGVLELRVIDRMVGWVERETQRALDPHH